MAIVVVSLLLLGGLLYVNRAPDDGGKLPGRQHAGMSNASCQKCHQEVWDEWSESRHAITFTSTHTQAAFQHFGFDRKCESCHAPEPVLAMGLDRPPVLRAENRDSGVNCLTCHATADGRVAAARTIESAPCQPVKTPALHTSAHCASCHKAVFEDWQASSYAATGQTCQTCHMRSSGDNSRVSHLCTGGHNNALLRSGAKMECKIAPGQPRRVDVAVTNHATGHNFPGERHNRELYLQVTQFDASGGIAKIQQELIKGVTPFRGETTAEQIRAGHTFKTHFPLEAAADTVEVQLRYKLFRIQTNREAVIVHEQTQKVK